jgi:hypothetical protein
MSIVWKQAKNHSPMGTEATNVATNVAQMKHTPETTIEGNKKEKCKWHKETSLSYVAFFEDCEKRAAKGQEQKQCPICLYWFWPDKMGRMPKTTTAHLNDPEGGRKDKK